MSSAKHFWLDGVELFLVIAAAPLLLSPRGPLPWIGLGLLLASWIWRRLITRRWLTRTPLDRPILILFLMTLASLYPSVDLSLSAPKFYGLLLGFFIYYAAVNITSSERRFWLGMGLLLASVVAISILGLIGTEWHAGKLLVPQQAYSLIPRVIRGVQTSSWVVAGFHPNELGGTLAVLLPLPMALFVRRSTAYSVPTLVQRAALVSIILSGLGVLVLTASRSAIMAVGVSVVLLVVWRWRRPGFALVAIGVAAVGVTLILNAPAVGDFLLKADAVSVAPGAGSLLGRLDVWERARYMIEDFPFTGIGLNTFPVVLDTLYPSFLAGPAAPIPHAHNIFLQTAIDLGLGGLLGLLGLWACVAHAGWRAYRHVREGGVRGPFQAAIVGILLGLLSYLIFGLTDAITLGAKPTVLLWLMMGLLVSIQRITFNAHLPTPASQPVTPNSYPFLRRAVRFLLVTAWDFYWIITFALVGLGFLVVAIAISGWIP